MSTVYKKVLPVLLILLVLIAAISWGLTFLFSDPETTAYRTAISGIQSQKVYHAIHTHTYTCGEETSVNTREIYRSYPNFSDEQKRNGSTYAFLVCYDGQIDQALPELKSWKAEDYESYPSPYNIPATYYRANLKEKDISIEKTDSGYVCTYLNRSRLGKDAYEEASIGPIEDATMVSYFDADWNFQRLTITEVRQKTLPDGSTTPVTDTDEIVYLPTSVQQIDAVLKEYSDRYEGPAPVIPK